MALSEDGGLSRFAYFAWNSISIGKSVGDGDARADAFSRAGLGIQSEIVAEEQLILAVLSC